MAGWRRAVDLAMTAEDVVQGAQQFVESGESRRRREQPVEVRWRGRWFVTGQRPPIEAAANDNPRTVRGGDHGAVGQCPGRHGQGVQPLRPPRQPFAVQGRVYRRDRGKIHVIADRPRGPKAHCRVPPAEKAGPAPGGERRRPV